MKGLLVLLAAAVSASALAVVPAAAGGIGGSDSASAVQTLTVRSSRYGRILFDGRGRVLYAFTRERRGGPSRCYGACAAAWPVYFSKRTGVRAEPESRNR